MKFIWRTWPTHGERDSIQVIYCFYFLCAMELSIVDKTGKHHSTVLTFIPNQLMLIEFGIVPYGCFPKSLWAIQIGWDCQLTQHDLTCEKRLNFSNFLTMCLLTFLSKKAKFDYFLEKKQKQNKNMRKETALHESIWYENFYLHGHFSSTVVPKIFRVRALGEWNWTPGAKGKFTSHYGILCLWNYLDYSTKYVY